MEIILVLLLIVLIIILSLLISTVIFGGTYEVKNSTELNAELIKMIEDDYEINGEKYKAKYKIEDCDEILSSPEEFKNELDKDENNAETIYIKTLINGLVELEDAYTDMHDLINTASYKLTYAITEYEADFDGVEYINKLNKYNKEKLNTRDVKLEKLLTYLEDDYGYEMSEIAQSAVAFNQKYYTLSDDVDVVANILVEVVDIHKDRKWGRIYRECKELQAAQNRAN